MNTHHETDWQQRFERTDPWPEIPFADQAYRSVDHIVGLACIISLIVTIPFWR